jgi:hypothetical protein
MIEAARADYVRVLDTVLDDQADLARIYARYGQQPPASDGAPEPGSQVESACARIEMLEAAVAAATGPGAAGLGGLYLKMARRYLYELRTGLLRRQLTRDDAHRLLNSAEHNLREAGPALGAQHDLTQEADRAPVSDLRDLAADMSAQMKAVRDTVMRLFDLSGDSALILAGR